MGMLENKEERHEEEREEKERGEKEREEKERDEEERNEDQMDDKESHEEERDEQERNKEASKLLNLINIIREANNENKRERKGKKVDLFSLLPETKNNIESGENIKNKLPEHMRRFFLPADTIIPKQYSRRGKHRHIGRGDPYAPEYDFDSMDGSDWEIGDTGGDIDCYTHTMLLDGECWVMCDKTPLWPCNSTISPTAI